MQIFQRNGKRLTGITEPGRHIVKLAATVMLEMQNIKRVGDEFAKVETGTLTIATTHTQARYKLPAAVKQFIEMYPHVKLNIHQGSPSDVTAQVANGEADIGIATEATLKLAQVPLHVPVMVLATAGAATPLPVIVMTFTPAV